MKIVDKIEALLIPTHLPIFGFDISTKSNELKSALIAIEEIKLSNPEKRTSNVVGEWLSPKNSHIINPKLLPLCKLVTDICAQIWRDIYNNGEGNFQEDFYIWQCWCVEYGDRGFAESHNHLPTFFGAVTYLEVDENSSPIVFGNNSILPCLENSLYIFPGILQHSVPLNKGKRKIVAMNILKKNPH